MEKLEFNGRILTHPALETVLGATGVCGEGWSRNARDEGIFVDLSKVEWCDLSAAVRLVLLVESALKEGVNVQIALPLVRGRKSELIFIQECEERLWDEDLRAVRRRIERRRRTLEFLRYINFFRN